jgi:hypothetical protein
MKFDFKKIYVQRSIYEDFIWRANAENIIKSFPQAKIVEVESHWKIPELYEADAGDWMKIKRETLVLGIKSGLTHTKNGRSADFIAASNSNGCLSSCQYCYVARRKGGSNPLTIFVNIEEIAASIRKHQTKLGAKPAPNQCDPRFGLTTSAATPIYRLIRLSAIIPAFLVREFARWKTPKRVLRRKPFTTIIGRRLTRKAKRAFDTA